MSDLKHHRTLTEAIAHYCKGVYRVPRLGPTAIVRGQAFTYLQRSLRDDGWKGVTYSNLSQQIAASKELGWDRGRGRRCAHGGKMMWGTPCDVIYVIASKSECTDEQIVLEEADETAHGWF